jgi:hypothetical protein
LRPRLHIETHRRRAAGQLAQVGHHFALRGEIYFSRGESRRRTGHTGLGIPEGNGIRFAIRGRRIERSPGRAANGDRRKKKDGWSGRNLACRKPLRSFDFYDTIASIGYRWRDQGTHSVRQAFIRQAFVSQASMVRAPCRGMPACPPQRSHAHSRGVDAQNLALPHLAD